MSLDQFVHNLQFDTAKVRPPDWEVDWEDAPLSYKLYRDLPVYPFPYDVPLTLEDKQTSSPPNFKGIGDFLWYAYGLTGVSQFLNGSENVQSFRRFAPSGGALYPNEVYMYLKLEDLPVGVYHYDVAHHRLVLLREGNVDDYVAQALGTGDMQGSFGAVFVTTMFWKNFYKYHNFSYRLQGLDTGVLLGQLQEVAKRFGFKTEVSFQFLDRAINHLIGISEKEESTYAVMNLYAGATESTFSCGPPQTVTASELCKELPEISCTHDVRSKNILDYPMLLLMNEASMIHSTDSFQRVKKKGTEEKTGKEIQLPPVTSWAYDLADACRNRFSPEMDFTLGNVSQTELATLLQKSMAAYPYRNDLDVGEGSSTDLVSMYACLHQVEGLEDGAYHYDRSAHALRMVEFGDFRVQLQYALTLDNVNLQQVPICLHVVGNRDFLKEELGYRGYRIQQMAAGMLVQRLLLVATALGLGGHPLLGYDVNASDRMYKITPLGKTSLIQIPIGPYRGRPWLKGSMHS